MGVPLRIYFAAPIVKKANQSTTEHFQWMEQRKNMRDMIVRMLNALHDEFPEYSGCTFYDPMKMQVPNAWCMDSETWAHCVFSIDVHELDAANVVVFLDYGRECTFGTAWEVGYAFAKDKRIIQIMMPPQEEDKDVPTSVMAVGSAWRCEGYNLLMKQFGDAEKPIDPKDADEFFSNSNLRDGIGYGFA